MTRRLCFAALALAALLVSAGVADAERVPSARTVTLPSTGARPDFTVPYTTNGRSTLGVYNGVAPAIVSQSGLGNAGDASVRQVYNLPYYGAAQSFNSSFVGAMQRPANSLRPGR
jgi:hypothetical protein